MSVECPKCDYEGEHIGMHWTRSKDCSHPPLTTKQRDVIQALVMGDGSVELSNANARLSVVMSSKEYLEYLDKVVFGLLSTGVRISKTAEESASCARKSGFRPNAESENYKDLHVLRTRRHPDICDFITDNGRSNMAWPLWYDISPTVMKHWYASDGWYRTDNGHRYMAISTNTDVVGKDRLVSMFADSKAPNPNRVDVTPTDYNTTKLKLIWSVDGSEEMFEYMGNSLPGFEYKWPNGGE